MKKKIEQILSLPKSIYVCLRLMPFKQAIFVPVFVRFNTKVLSLKGKVVCSSYRTGSIKIGFGHVGVFDKTYERAILQIDGTIKFHNNNGIIFFGHGSRISVSKGAVLEIGSNYSNTAMNTIVCKKNITIGNNVTTSWNTLIMDTDFHATRNTETGTINSFEGPVCIGNNVWLCTRSIILKGSRIPDGCIVGANAVVTKIFFTDNSLIAGNPATECKHNITIEK